MTDRLTPDELAERAHDPSLPYAVRQLGALTAIYELLRGGALSDREPTAEPAWVDERPPRCRICGCTDDHACPGGCSWVAPDLCSTCEGLRQHVLDELLRDQKRPLDPAVFEPYLRPLATFDPKVVIRHHAVDDPPQPEQSVLMFMLDGVLNLPHNGFRVNTPMTVRAEVTHRPGNVRPTLLTIKVPRGELNDPFELQLPLTGSTALDFGAAVMP